MATNWVAVQKQRHLKASDEGKGRTCIEKGDIIRNISWFTHFLVPCWTETLKQVPKLASFQNYWIRTILNQAGKTRWNTRTLTPWQSQSGSLKPWWSLQNVKNAWLQSWQQTWYTKWKKQQMTPIQEATNTADRFKKFFQSDIRSVSKGQTSHSHTTDADAVCK